MGITALAYQNCIDAHYQMWCSKYAELFRLPLAAMVADDHIQNWYRDQWLKSVEFPFYMANTDLMDSLVDSPVVDQSIMQDIFLTYPEDIDGTWPQTLFDDLKKRTRFEDLKKDVKRTNTTVKQ